MKHLLMLLCFGVVSVNAVAASEELLGVIFDRTGATFQVASGGCTKKAHFQVLAAESDPVQLTLVRKKQDPCDGFLPYGILVKFTYGEMGLNSGTRYVLQNDLTSVRVVR